MKKVVLIAGLVFVFAILACNRTAPQKEQTVTPPPTIPLGDATPTAASATLPPGVTPLPTLTGVSSTPPTPAATECTYDVDYVDDVTIPDDSELEPGESFVKTWRLRNVGTCAWEVGAAWVFVSGEQMSGPDSVGVPAVEPGGTADVSVNLAAPEEPGKYTGHWRLSRPNDGERFGTQCYVRIIVPSEGEPTPTAVPATARPGTGPTLEYFRANTQQADPGDTITLEWKSEDASRAILHHLAPSGQFESTWTVEPTGSYEYEIGEDERNETAFKLQVFDSQEQMAEASLTVALVCPDEWFFTPAPDECPRGPAIESNAVEQHFEHGAMVWVEAQDMIYVIFDDGKVPGWKVYPDEWQVGDPESDPSIVPPTGRYQPLRGFGLVWREQAGVRERLSWAIAQETTFDTAVQSSARAKYNDTYLRALDGDIWWLKNQGTGWAKIGQ